MGGVDLSPRPPHDAAARAEVLILGEGTNLERGY